MRWLLFIRFALKDLCYDWQRSLLSFVKLSVMVCSYLLVAALGQSFLAFTTSATTSAHNLMILSRGMLEPSESSLPPELLQQAVQLVQAQFGEQVVRASVPVLFQHLNLDSNVMQVVAVPADSFEAVFHLELLEGEWPSGLGEAAASRGAAQSAGWQLGETLTIYGQPIKLSAIFESTSRSSASLWMDWATGVNTLGLQRGIQIGTLQIDPQANLPSIQAWLEAAPLLAGRYEVYQEAQVNSLLDRAVHGFRPMGELFRWMALLALIFGGFNVASLTLLERHAETGLLRQVGFTEGAIAAFVMCRTTLLSLLAYPFGWIGAFFLQLPQQEGFVFYGAHLDISLNNQTTWIGLALALLSTLLGAGLAVRHSQRTFAAEAQR